MSDIVRGEGLQSANDGLGSFTGTLRGWLDGLASIDIWFNDLGCWLQGTFLGNWAC